MTKTARELKELVERREVQPREVTEAFLARIEAVDPELGAYVTVTGEGALAEAEEAAARGLAGVPVAVKDSLSTAGVRTTAASRMLADYVPPFDATSVVRLREAGLPLLGKTNMDEFAMGSSTETSALKQTRNPWDAGRVPGGSSGGSAAAVAAHLAPWALGSDTGGSIRQPAALCGIVGLKPTYGRVSRFGLIPLAPSLDCVGPMTKDVADAALLLNVIAGHDPADSTSARGDVPDFTAALGREVKGLRLGLPREYFGPGVDGEVAAAVRRAAETLEGLGASVEEISLPLSGHGIAVYYAVMAGEASSSLARYDGVRYGYRSRDAEDSVRMFENSRGEGFGPEVKWRIVLGTWVLGEGRKETIYFRAQRVRARLRREFEEAFRRVDLLLTPTSPTVAFPFGTLEADEERAYAADLCTVPASLAGLPAISVPCGVSEDGLPIGLQIIGRPFAEETVLQAAYAYEQAAGAHRWRLGEEVPALGR